MYRTYIYLPEELASEIDRTARTQKKSKAEVIRQALINGFKTTNPQKSSSAKSLLEMAKKAEKLDVSGPTDLAEKHNVYTWD